jgi:hypothetical protein
VSSVWQEADRRRASDGREEMSSEQNKRSNHMDLKCMLEEMATTAADDQSRRRILAALRIGARIALQRVRVVGSSYVTGADLAIVEQELDGITPETPIPSQVPEAAPEAEEIPL